MFISDNNKKTFKSIVLLDEMVNGSHQFQTVANGDDSVLEPLFIELMSKGYVVTSGINYKITDKGQQVLDTFMKRYTEYLKVYDVFSFVDLEKGEFAFARYYDFDSDDAWADFTNDQRFDDLRIAVALFKKIDPAEIVFMSFINENRFDTKSNGWQMDLVSDNSWNEIEEICKTAIKPEEVGEDAMLDMIGQGAELMIKLIEEEKQQEQNNGNYGQSTETVVEEETVEYYQPYYDPYYVSPIWLLPLFLW
ncbi:hypothetical protein ACPPVU_18325 [Mucilaginibacter sp. McL0603]|uniref:hypothetical protein n=1 Tax=Mucilaginibacter sp. McL0603 TaxID=3415670 RepID=UPI003CEE2A96